MDSEVDTPVLKSRDGPGISFLSGGGEAGALLRAYDWNSSPLEPPERWSEALRTVVSIMLGSAQPMLAVWGPERTALYNDGYAEMCGARHPRALGRPFDELWFDIWDQVEPILARAYAGESTRMDDIQFEMHRNGYPEETHFAFSYTPVRDETGAIAGMFCACAETTEQVLAERRRAAETERQQRLFENAPSFIAILSGPDHVFEFANQAYVRLIGGRDPAGLTVRDALPEVAGQGFFELLDQVYASGERFTADQVPIRLQHSADPSIEERFVDFVYEPVKDETGAVTGIFVEGHDVTSQKHAEAALRESEGRYREIVEGAEDFAIITLDEGGIVTSWNRGAERIAGYSEAEAVGQPGDIIFTPEDRDAGVPDQEINRAQTDGRAADERWHHRKDGSRFWGSGLMMRRDTAGGGYLKIFRDRTAEHTAEAALRQGEERYRALYESIETGFCIIEVAFDEAGRAVDYCFREVNPAFERLTGIESGYNRWMREIAPDQEQYWFDIYGDVVKTGKPNRFENEAAALGRWFDVYAYRVGEQGNYRAAVLFTEITKRKRAELALRETAEELQTVLDAVPAAIWIARDPEAREIIGNRMSYDLLRLGHGVNASLSAAEAERPSGFTICKDGRPLAPEELPVQMAAAGKPVKDFEEEVRFGDGTSISLFGNATPLRDPSGTIRGSIAAFVDVTAAKRAEQTLRESEARLRALTDHLPGGMVYQIATGRDGTERRFLYVSQSHERLTGIPAEAVLADPTIPYMLIHEEDRPRLAAAEAEAIETRVSFDVQARFRRADGELRWCRIISAPREQPDGSLVWDGIQIDITEQKATEEALRLRGEEFYALADNIPSLCWIAYADGHIYWYNRRWYEYTGTGPADMKGWGWQSVHDPEMLPKVSERWAHSLSTGEPFEMVFPLKGADGAFRPFLTRVVPIRDESGAVARWFGTNADISAQVEAERLLERRVEERTAELVQAQEALRQSQKLEAMGQLTGGVAHDFNNLLTPIIGSLDLLQRKGIGNEREQRLIGGAMQSAERAKTLVQRLLAFARRQPLKPMPVDVGTLIAGMADLVASTSGPQVKVAVDVAPNLPAATADPNQLEMAILNLSVNARDAMPDGGTLTIAAMLEVVDPGHRAKLRPGDYVRLSVADTGTGMDETTLGHAIEPFFSTKGIGKGTGLGLSMVHGLASQLGGALTISSKPGLGTNVELWLPVSERRAEADSQRDEAAPETKGIGIALLVDDEELVRMSTADMLADIGFAVVEAASGEEALRLIEAGCEVDLLVTDHLMPGMTGADLARAVRDRRPDTPVLIVSGYAEAEAIAPDLPRLTKPFRQSDLAASILELRGATHA